MLKEMDLIVKKIQKVGDETPSLVTEMKLGRILPEPDCQEVAQDVKWPEVKFVPKWQDSNFSREEKREEKALHHSISRISIDLPKVNDFSIK